MFKTAIISLNLKRLCDHDHAYLKDYLTKFEVTSLSHSRDILGDYKFKMGHVGHLFWYSLLSVA